MPHRSAGAQSYPTRPITIIVPYPAGGPSDVLTRILAERMKTALGQTVIIENVTGAGGSIGVGRVARSAPDGYTLAIGHNQTHVINAASMNLPYDVVKDFEPVVADCRHAAMADQPQDPAGQRRQGVDRLAQGQQGDRRRGRRRRPDRSLGAVVPEGDRHDIPVRALPRRRTAAAGPLAGQIDIAFGQAANYLGPVRGGQLKAFAVLSKQRWWAAPDVPTMDEAGVPGLHASFWHGLWAPKGTPKDIIAKLDAADVETLADPAVQQRLKDIGQEPWPRDKQTPEALAAQQKNEIEVWWPVIKAHNIKGE